MNDDEFQFTLEPILVVVENMAVDFLEQLGSLSLPRASSDAMADIAADRAQSWVELHGASVIEQMHNDLKLVLFAGAERLRSAACLYRFDYRPVYSSSVLVRSSLESLGIGYWLTEPDIGTTERKARALAHQKALPRHASKLSLDAGVDSAGEAERKSIAVSDLAQLREQLKLLVGEPNRERPKFVDLVAGLFPDSAIADKDLIYRVLSGEAHSTTLILKGETRGGLPIGADTFVPEEHAESARRVLHVNLFALLRTANRFLHYYQTPGSVWEAGDSALRAYQQSLEG